MIFYLLAIIIFFIILFFSYVRLKYKFWSLQPVFHFYDIYYWIFNVGIIRKELPDKNRYVNLKQIVTKSPEFIGELTKKQIVTLIRLNYWRNNENKYEPALNNIAPYFVGHHCATFWSYFVEPELFIDNKTSKTITEHNIIGVITSRPLHVMLRGNQFDVYYVDYLCVNRNKRKQNIAPQLIQTHEFNQSHNNRRICVSLFKREEELTGIIPLTVYKTYCFHMANWTTPFPLHASIQLLTGDKQNMYYLYNFINETNKKWDISIYPEISNIIELVTTQNLFVKMLVCNTEIVAVYVFRKTCLFIEKGKEVISCIASINGSILTKEEFIAGFKVSLWSIIKEYQNFRFLTIEDISDNTCIINNICAKTWPTIVSPMAYFFYNFAHSPFQSAKCLILN